MHLTTRTALQVAKPYTGMADSASEIEACSTRLLAATPRAPRRLGCKKAPKAPLAGDNRNHVTHPPHVLA